VQIVFNYFAPVSRYICIFELSRKSFGGELTASSERLSWPFLQGGSRVFPIIAGANTRKDGDEWSNEVVLHESF
jgi:hypothetical protein